MLFLDDLIEIMDNDATSLMLIYAFGRLFFFTNICTKSFIFDTNAVKSILKYILHINYIYNLYFNEIISQSISIPNKKGSIYFKRLLHNRKQSVFY